MSRSDDIRRKLESAPIGMHRLGDGAYMLDSEIPSSLAESLLAFNGAELFFESFVLNTSKEIKQDPKGRWLAGHYGGADIWVDSKDRVFQWSEEDDFEICEGTRFDRFLAGCFDAETILYDSKGEFLDNLFDDAGQPTLETQIARAQARIKRDPKAVGPRWRLSQAYSDQGKQKQARGLLEDIVGDAPNFSWAWMDLADISYALGQHKLACEEAEWAADNERESKAKCLFLGSGREIRRNIRQRFL